MTDRFGNADYCEGEAEYERELNRLLALRDLALAVNSGFQLQQAEALLDAHCPDWRKDFDL